MLIGRLNRLLTLYFYQVGTLTYVVQPLFKRFKDWPACAQTRLQATPSGNCC